MRSEIETSIGSNEEGFIGLGFRVAHYNLHDVLSFAYASEDRWFWRLEITGESISIGITLRIVVLTGESDVPEFVGDSAPNDDALAPGLVSGSADFDRVLAWDDASDMVTLIELIKLAARDQCIIDADADLDGIGFERDGSSVDKYATFKIETIPESIEKDTAGSSEE